MFSAPIPPDEAARLQALHACGILDTLPERDFDDLVALASHICGTPMALISLVDAERQWFKAAKGIKATGTPRDVSFCAHTILRDDIMVIADARQDPRFCDNPLVVQEPHIRFYAGTPLTTSAGLNIGSLCVVDQRPRLLTEPQLNAMRALSRQVMAQVDLRMAAREAQRARKIREEMETHLRSSEAMFRELAENSPAAAFIKDEQGVYRYTNRQLQRSFQRFADTWVGRCDADILPPDVARKLRADDQAVMANNVRMESDDLFPAPDGGVEHWHVVKFPLSLPNGPRCLGGVAINVTKPTNLAEPARPIA